MASFLMHMLLLGVVASTPESVSRVNGPRPVPGPPAYKMTDSDPVAKMYAKDLEWIAEVVDHPDVRGFLEQDRRRMQHIALGVILGFVLLFGGIVSAMVLSQKQTRGGKAARWLLHGAFTGVEEVSGAVAGVVLYIMSGLCRIVGLFTGVLSQVNLSKRAGYLLELCASAGQVELSGSRERLVQKLLSEDESPAKVEEGKPTKKKKEKKEPEKKAEKDEAPKKEEPKPSAKVEPKTSVRAEAASRKKADAPARKATPAPEIPVDEADPAPAGPPHLEELAEVLGDEMEGIPDEFWSDVQCEKMEEMHDETLEEWHAEKVEDWHAEKVEETHDEKAEEIQGESEKVEEKPVKKPKKVASPVMPMRPTAKPAVSMALPPVRSAPRAVQELPPVRVPAAR